MENPEGGEVECPQCTYKNPPTAGVCEMCFNSMSSRACPFCTFLNPLSSKICSMCSKTLQDATPVPNEVVLDDDETFMLRAVQSITDGDVTNSRMTAAILEQEMIAEHLTRPAARTTGFIDDPLNFVDSEEEEPAIQFDDAQFPEHNILVPEIAPMVQQTDQPDVQNDISSPTAVPPVAELIDVSREPDIESAVDILSRLNRVCPAPNCGATCPVSPGGDNMVTCPQCNHVFCDGCQKPYLDGQKCAVFDECVSRTRHAHHPRNCMYYLREFDVRVLQQLLKENQVKYEVNPKIPHQRCPITELVSSSTKSSETPGDIPVDELVDIEDDHVTVEPDISEERPEETEKSGRQIVETKKCDRRTRAGHAGVCKAHYREYLISLINTHKLDPVEIMGEDEMRTVISREKLDTPEHTDNYTETLREYIKSLIPIHIEIEEGSWDERKECSMCTEKYMMDSLETLMFCQCLICADCFRQFYEFSIREKHLAHFSCPNCRLPEMVKNNPDTSQHLWFLESKLKHWVDSDLHQLLQNKIRDWSLSDLENFAWCAHCSNGFETQNDGHIVKCPLCNKYTCSKCKVKWEDGHIDRTCEEFANYKETLDNNGVLKLLQLNETSCPKCKTVFILERGGCKHLTCPACKYNFCEGCQQEFSEATACGKFTDCSKKGLHAHHPRSCIYYLRDYNTDSLKQLLQKGNIEFHTQSEEIRDVSQGCPLMELKEHTSEGATSTSNEPCGKEVREGQAGVCENHFKEYLIKEINRHTLDPVDIMTGSEMITVLEREHQVMPPGAGDDVLRELIKTKLVL